ncbi:hypothetical protein EPO33_00030 [Patescibacteria group bacterium]|nr:MAG: hypothetical protein EPO33_00030 [Patescibacteria group bacterium]
MSGEGLSNIKIDGEKLLAIEDVLGIEKAREMAQAQRGKSFGGLLNMLNRPRAEDIDVVYEEKRYEAFWRVLGTARYEYKRRTTYKVPVEPMVKDVELLGTTFDAQAKTIGLEGVEHCVEEYREEKLIDAQTDQAGAFEKYLARASRQIETTEELTKDGTPIVALAAKPAFLVRTVVNALIKPIKADQILDEQIAISELALYFIPVYTFEFHWKPKDKRVTVSFDGATGEMRPQANKIAERLRGSFTNDEMFEFGKEVANFVPGGGLAMMAGKKAFELYKKK